jgi:hypothetical protein
MRINTDATTLAAHYRVMNNINTTVGAVPYNNHIIGDTYATRFNGVFDGGNNTITLDINFLPPNTRSTVGLFGTVGGSGVVRNLTVAGSISVEGGGIVGGIVGENYGRIDNCTVSANIRGDGGAVGGITGRNFEYDDGIENGIISNCNVTGNIMAGTTGDQIGGIAGFNRSEIRNSSHTTGTVSGRDEVGGIVGQNHGLINNSHAAGTVSGEWGVGGVAGSNSQWGVAFGTITNSYATASVSGEDSVGGIAGFNSANSSITGSYATGNVSGNGEVGGVAGENHGTITGNHSIGNVTGTANSIGGIAGSNRGTITNSHATGNIGGTYSIGGLVGTNGHSIVGAGGTIVDSYATGDVTGQDFVGGIVGSNNPTGSVQNSEARNLNITATNMSGNDIGRVVGSNINPTGLNNNRANAAMMVNGAQITTADPRYGADDIHGLNGPPWLLP